MSWLHPYCQTSWQSILIALGDQNIMTTSNLISNRYSKINRNFFLVGILLSSSFIIALLASEFHYQYLHNPAVHIFFQSKGIFLF